MGHFYTISQAERDHIMRTYPTHVWKYEGPKYGAFATRQPGTVPLFRFWSDAFAGHFYTTSVAERDYVINAYDDYVWKYERVAYYVYPMDTSVTPTNAVSRFWSDTYRHHFYTASATEAAHVRATYPRHIWLYESERFRVPTGVPAAAPLPALPPPPPPTTPAPSVPSNPGDVKNCADFANYAEAHAWFWTYPPLRRHSAPRSGRRSHRMRKPSRRSLTMTKEAVADHKITCFLDIGRVRWCLCRRSTRSVHACREALMWGQWSLALRTSTPRREP